MDSVKEKLVELIAQKVCDAYSPNCDEWEPHDCGRCYANDCHISDIADHLIANGVTVQDGEDNNVPTKWISVKDRLPEKNGKYLVFKDLCSSPYNVSAVWFAKDGEKVSKYNLAGEKNVWYEYDSEYGHITCDCVTHWIPLPQPPKGE